MLVIPAIDLLGGRCVRLHRGRYEEETVYSDAPAGVAREWVRQGARRLHVVDLDGARAGRPVHLDAVREIAAAAGVPVQLGGGLRSLDDVAAALAAGADRVLLGTRAVADPAFLAEAAVRHPGRVLVSLDVRGGRVAVAGWLETAALTFDEALDRLAALDLRDIVVTDVERDGTLAGVNPDLVRRAARRGFRVIAAGGVATVEDIRALKALEPEGLTGVIAGKALYAGTLSLPEALAVAEGA